MGSVGILIELVETALDLHCHRKTSLSSPTFIRFFSRYYADFSLWISWVGVI